MVLPKASPPPQRTRFLFGLEAPSGIVRLMSNPRLVPTRITSARDNVFPKVLFSGEGVVGAAAQGDVLQEVLAAEREG